MAPATLRPALSRAAAGSAADIASVHVSYQQATEHRAIKCSLDLLLDHVVQSVRSKQVG